MGIASASTISSRWMFVTGTSAVGTRYSSSRVTTYISSSLSGSLPVRAHLAPVGSDVGRGVAPGAHDDAVLFAAHGHIRVGRVGDAQEELPEVRLDGRQLPIEGLDAGAHDRRALAQGGGLRAPRIGTGLDRLADLLRDGVPLGLQPVGF